MARVGLHKLNVGGGGKRVGHTCWPTGERRLRESWAAQEGRMGSGLGERGRELGTWAKGRGGGFVLFVLYFFSKFSKPFENYFKINLNSF